MEAVATFHAESAALKEPAASSRARLAWLDFYRGLAVVVMIETHVVNTFLSVATGSDPPRVTLNYFNGLVAPAFLFIAGLAHGLGLRRKRAVRARMTPRLFRLAGIAAIGYAMHWPLAALLRGDGEMAWRIGSQMDVLPCLAISIAILIIIERVCGRAVNVGVAMATAAVLVAAPLLASWTAGPVPLRAVLNQSTGSLFPLLPWSAFVFCGFGVAGLAASWKRIAVLIVGCLGAVALHGRTGLTPTSHAFFLERLAWVLALVPACQWLSARWSPPALLFAGRESLAIYLAHLFLIGSIAPLLGNHLDFRKAALLYLALVLASFAIARGWRQFTVWNADRVRRAARRRESSMPAA